MIEANPQSPLPLTLVQVDQEWISQALRVASPNVNLHGCEILEVIHGTCTKVRIRLDLDDEGRHAGIPEQVILKGGFEAHSRLMPYMHHAEVRAYRDVLPVLRLNSPQCLFAHFDHDTGQGIVILEDLTARGVSFCHPLRPQTREQVSRRLSYLARFHARTWGSDELEPGGRFDWLNPIIPKEGGHLRQFMEPEVWGNFMELPRGRAVSVRFQDLSWMSDALERLSVLAEAMPHALLHGDTHLGNLYEDADGTPGFFDSSPHRWPGIAEVAYHLGGALDPIDRRAWERSLVEHYLQEISQAGIAVPPLDEAMQQYAAFLAYGFCIFAINDSAFQTEAINTAYTARFGAAMIDNQTIDALSSVS